MQSYIFKILGGNFSNISKYLHNITPHLRNVPGLLGRCFVFTVSLKSDSFKTLKIYEQNKTAYY